MEAACPFCRTSRRISPREAGRIVMCTSCKQTFLAPKDAMAAQTPTVPMAAKASTKPESYSPPAAVSPKPPIRGDASQSPTQSAVTMPDSPRELDDDDIDDSPINLLNLCLVGGGFCLIAAAFLLLVLFLRFRDRSDEPLNDPSTVVQNELDNDERPRQLVLELPGIERDRPGRGNTFKINHVEVEVTHVEYGAVRAKNAAHHVVIFRDRNYIQIFLSIKNFQPSPLPYRSWYNAHSSTATEWDATLIDDRGNVYPVVMFANVESIRGHTPTATIEPGKRIEDALVFALPENVTPATIRYFSLDLPAAAYQGRGYHAFQIPRDVVQGF